jgi:hypothetical protein
MAGRKRAVKYPAMIRVIVVATHEVCARSSGD